MNLLIFGGIAGVIMMLSGLFIKNKRSVSYLAIGLMVFLLLTNSLELSGRVWFHFNTHGMLVTSEFGLLINAILLAAGLFYFLLSGRDIEKTGNHPSDYYALIFFIYAGIAIATSYESLLLLFLGIEIISIPLYILTGADKRNLKSNEASLKYFLMGSFSTGLMLMGIALVYGASGTFMIQNINYGSVNYNLLGGLLLLLVSMSFKVSAAPFHFWTPDVYDGAPTVFTSFMATIVKVAAFIAFIKLFDGAHISFVGTANHSNKWPVIISAIIAITLLIGNITAVFQQSVKRMLAYSSIAQAGFMLFALFAFNTTSKDGIVLYSAAYCFATIGIFSILSKMDDYTFEGFNGFAKKQPMLAALNTIFFLSLAGIPLTAGFWGKYYMISSAIETGGSYLWLFVLAMLCAAVSVYYYFRVIQAMYFKNGDGQTIVVTPAFKVALLVVAAVVIILGAIPQILLQYLYF